MTAEFEKQFLAQQAILIRQIGQIANDIRSIRDVMTGQAEADRIKNRKPIEISPSAMAKI